MGIGALNVPSHGPSQVPVSCPSRGARRTPLRLSRRPNRDMHEGGRGRGSLRGFDRCEIDMHGPAWRCSRPPEGRGPRACGKLFHGKRLYSCTCHKGLLPRCYLRGGDDQPRPWLLIIKHWWSTRGPASAAMWSPRLGRYPTTPTATASSVAWK